MDKSTKDTLLKVALYGGLAYLGYVLVSKLFNATSNAIQNTASDIVDLIGPDVNANSALYQVAFPDGSKHLIDSQTITRNWFSPDTFIAPKAPWFDAAGYTGRVFALKSDTPGNYYAVPTASGQ